MGKQADLLKDSDADSNSIARLARETAAEIIGNLGDDPQVLADFGPYDCTEGDYLVLEDELGREPTDAEEQLAAARHFGLVPGRPGETTQPCFGR